MSSSDGEGPGQKPKQPVSSTLAGMPPPKDPPASGATRAPLPPPKAPPGGRPSSPTNPPALRRDVSGAGPLPQPPQAIPAEPATAPSPQPLPIGVSVPYPHPGYQSQPVTTTATGIPQPGAPQQSAPHPLSAPHPFPGAPGASGPVTSPHPFAPQASNPIAAPHQPAFAQPTGPIGPAHPGPSGPVATTQHGFGGGYDSLEEVPGSQFVKFLKISSRRAFRLRIEPSEVLPSERASLESANPPILDSNLQAFLAWRRSVLFLVAVALVPLSIIGLVDAMAGSMPTPIRFVKLAPALAEALFCWICWGQLKRWSHWRKQRRYLFWGWLLFMATPFVVFLYPLRPVLLDTISSSTQALSEFGLNTAYRRGVMPFVAAMIAMLQLAPKAISLMPGLIRASLVTKLLFPGSTAPGWLIAMCAPLYALLAYVILIIPYQFTGSGWFVFGVLGVVAGQAVLAKAGFELARPLDEVEALKHIRRVRIYYMAVMVISAVLIVVALGSLINELNMRATDVITAVMKFETNVLILTMIGADLVVTNLDRARSSTVGKGHVEEQAEVKIAAFVSLDAPNVPPPSGPAQ